MKTISHRYDRQIALPEIGKEGQSRLLNAKVLVIGAGGLGCPVMQQLAAMGVGTIGIVDGDIVDVTNLHRQILFTLEDCGRSKAEVAAEKIKKLNPELEVYISTDFFTHANAFELTKEYNVIVDCTDTIDARYLINDIALVRNIPVVYGSIHKFEGQLSVFNYNEGPSYRCLFPENKEKKEITTCVTSGVLGVLPNILGVLQANEVVKIVLGIGEVLSGKLMMYSALNSQSHFISFAKNEQQITVGKERGESLKVPPSGKINELNAEQFFYKINQSNSIILDVRTMSELPRLDFENCVVIPLDTLEENYISLDKENDIVLCCQSGKRSRKAIEILSKKGFTRLFNLKNGIQSLELLTKIQ